MPAVARVSDLTAHGGVIQTGNSTFLIEGWEVACVGDMHACPVVMGSVPHVGGVILPVWPCGVLVGGRPVARVGDPVACAGPQGTIITGSPTVIIG